MIWVLLILAMVAIIIVWRRRRKAARPAPRATEEVRPAPRATEEVRPTPRATESTMPATRISLDPAPAGAAVGSPAAIEYCKKQLERLTVAYVMRPPQMLLMCRNEEDAGRIRFEAIDAAVGAGNVFQNWDPEFIGFLRTHLEAGRQVAVSPASKTSLLVFVGKPGESLF
jgi:hypothetical protein